METNSSVSQTLDPTLLMSVASTRAACCLGLRFQEYKEILLTACTAESADTEYADAQLTVNRLFLRLCRALDCYYANDMKAEQQWLTRVIPDLSDTPLGVMRQPGGLKSIVEYMERQVLN